MATAVNERVDALLASGDAAAHCLVGATCDDAELACAGPIPEDWPRALQILGHLATGALVEAHLAWCRVPEPLRASDAELVAAKALLDALRRRDLAGLHARADGTSWSARAAPIVRAIASDARERALDLIARAYTTASVAHVAAALGTSAPDAIARCAARGWGVSEDGAWLDVVKPPVTEKQRAAIDALTSLTEVTTHLGDFALDTEQES
ncbi:uncharacterized protein MICPUCDRAFT_50489 [Micromonas pusilla CCMP1545]|jgi:COP9 signalosome complex subunit 8|uniref:Predicted protein n=1 Tax=Micromonas pusilla (strain CCMP1545) TaxID=564608 RepID=C1MI96_MICPC|nr:uncharacterized protein MICPUCDRAFT_50489 [Micromonas pusilla CCMP1545]EEH60342.1 predicted protein [Micromonas pusilla CCMP1545]|eukprot:XP_003055090.1 predicted protein [Micromonas pusilla CCMP1545]